MYSTVQFSSARVGTKHASQHARPCTDARPPCRHSVRNVEIRGGGTQ